MIDERKEWAIIDSTKVSDFQRCPRYYMYRHLFGWKSEHESQDLAFGIAWHLATEYLSIAGVVNEDTTNTAMNIFESSYRQKFAAITDLDFMPKTPGTARVALESYTLPEGELVYLNNRPATELFGIVSVGHELPVYFKMDVIYMRKPRTFYFVDRKTSKQDNPIYQQQWLMSNQMCTYYHALNCMFHGEKIEGGIVDLTIFRTKGCLHKHVPILKRVGDMNAWLFNINDVLDDIMSNTTKLLNPKQESLPQLQCFRKNEHGCIAYHRTCPYFDMCLSLDNPLQRFDTTPSGFVRDYWNPAAEATEGKFVDLKG